MKKQAFTSPSRGMSPVSDESRIIISEKRGFRFDCERYRFTRGRIVKQAAFTLAEVFSPHSANKRKVAFTLAEVFSPHSAGRRKIAFTLAEVLITLGIIGVVAALTLPTLVASHKEKARITALKKIYSQLQNAFNLATYEYGSLENWNLTPTNTGEKNENNELILDYSGADKFLANIAQYINKSNITEIKSDGNFSLDGRRLNEDMSIKIAQAKRNNILITNDGFILKMGWIDQSGKTGDFWVILPNEKKWITGVTSFHFKITKKGFIPDGQTQGDFAAQCNVKSKTIASDMNGRSCTAWALQNENMEYLRCNDLSWNGKQKCK